MVYSAKHREYQLVAKSTRVIFTMLIFSTVAPAVPPELGAQRKFLGARYKKISGAKFLPQLQNHVGAYAQ